MKTRPALTLVEMLVTVAILAVVAVPSYWAVTSFRQKQALATSVDDLTGTLKRAHIYAREGKDNKAWGVVYKDQKTFVLVSGTPSGFVPEAEYELAAPVVFVTSGWGVWFDRGTGDTAQAKELRVVVPSGDGVMVTISETGVVETR